MQNAAVETDVLCLMQANDTVNVGVTAGQGTAFELFIISEHFVNRIGTACEYMIDHMNTHTPHTCLAIQAVSHRAMTLLRGVMLRVSL